MAHPARRALKQRATTSWCHRCVLHCRFSPLQHQGSSFAPRITCSHICTPAGEVHRQLHMQSVRLHIQLYHVQAGYAVASYLVQSKDRHNGNILLDSEGRIVHIDFGFIFEISPGGNLGFERAAFKFSHEMVQLLDPGAQQQSTQYKQFKELCVRGFLAARTAAKDVMAVATLMADSGLPCFGRGKPLENLEARFMLDKSPAEAAAFMRSAVDGAHNSFTTGFYDYIQVQDLLCVTTHWSAGRLPGYCQDLINDVCKWKLRPV
jgi:Phosphatidylinositol 3- and 4-kinase